jgi:cytochrome c553
MVRTNSAWRIAAAAGLFLATVQPLVAQSEAPAAAQPCVACHGPGGASTQTQYPILAGQTARYIYLQLKDFKEGRRNDAQMSPMAAILSKEDMLALAEYFAAQPAPASTFDTDGAKAARGKDLADATLCTMCHQGSYQGQNEIPRLAGQHYDYLKKQLQDFRAKTRTNDAGNMTSVSKGLSDEDIENLAHYLAGMP